MRRAAFWAVAVAAVLGLAVTAPPARGQTSRFDEVAGGKTFPHRVKAADLTPDWLRLSTSGQTEGVNPYSYYGGLGLGVYYTRGQTVILGGETYLVAYKPQINARELMQELRYMGDPNEEIEPRRLARDAVLVLSLVNLRTTGNMDNIRPFDPSKDMERALTPAEGDAASTENLRRLGETVLRFARGHANRLPQMTDVATVRRTFFPYIVRRRSLLMHPRTQEIYRPNPLLSGKMLNLVKTPAKAVLFYEAGPGSDGRRGVLYLDGRTERVAEAQWPQVKKVSDAVQFAPPPRPVARANRRR